MISDGNVIEGTVYVLCCDPQVSSEAHPDVLSDTQTFTIGVVPQTPGMPQLSPGADLQVTVRDNHCKMQFSGTGFILLYDPIYGYIYSHFTNIRWTTY